MTCIVALIQDGVTYFAGDALTVNYPESFYSKVNQTVRKEPKVFAKNGMLFGYNGSVRMGQLLQYVFQIPEYTVGRTKVEYVVASFIPALQECFQKEKFEDDGIAGGILLAISGELLTINREFGVCNTAHPYESIGQASEVAIGSLHTSTSLGLPPLQCLHLALEATVQHTCVVNPPFTFITSEMEQVELLPVCLDNQEKEQDR